MELVFIRTPDDLFVTCDTDLHAVVSSVTIAQPLLIIILVFFQSTHGIASMQKKFHDDS